jgi:hypothetical protein
VPTPAGWGVDALRLPAIRAVVIKERAHHPEPVVVVMVKVVMGKALPVEFATHAATASLAHMASVDATAAAMGGKASAAKAAGMAATP